MKLKVLFIPILTASLIAGLTACAKPPAPFSPIDWAKGAVRGELRWTGSYARDIQPIFDRYCVSCHNQALAANGLQLDSYDGVMAGTQYGRVVFPGIAAGSTLVKVLEAEAPPQIHMPRQNLQLGSRYIQNLALWIEAGASKN